MRDFACPACGQQLTFENSLCLRCGTSVALDLLRRTFVVVADDAEVDDEAGHGRPCVNLGLAGCNWAAAPGGSEGLCPSCVLTRTRPADDDAAALSAFLDAETAKRRMLFELVELGLPIAEDESSGHPALCFDLLSSGGGPIVTGYAGGVITLDLAEGDDVHREQLRVSMDEPYRTLLGHFRHEAGHHYFDVLVQDEAARVGFKELFGDPDGDYPAALGRHYDEGPPPAWSREFVSAYASMHPAEDWAETFAHYLHIRDTLDTAAAFGHAPAGATLATPLSGPGAFERIIELWLPLAWSLNMINRSMGHHDLYPFVLPETALHKMRFVHDLVNATQVSVVAGA
ncbi:MAG TPA: putative zinc-binding metallopeptidase [Jatrophihabitans sp.]|jgi:hypothetical protein